MSPITEHVAKSPRHTTFYLAAGPKDGLPVIFVHGWPELSISWRRSVMGGWASRIFRCGYGRSTDRNDYRAAIVADMIELADSLGIRKAVWVGHDWGSPVVWNIASHHPERCIAVANLCVPYHALEYGLDYAITLVDRTVYPEATYPAGQWEYMRFYEANFADAMKAFDSHPYNVVKALFRKGDPAGQGKPSRTAEVRRNGGWFRDGVVPDVPRDAAFVTERICASTPRRWSRNAGFGPDSWYVTMPNAAYAATAAAAISTCQVLFLAARYDYTPPASVTSACPSRCASTAAPHRERFRQRPLDGPGEAGRRQPRADPLLATEGRRRLAGLIVRTPCRRATTLLAVLDLDHSRQDRGHGAM